MKPKKKSKMNIKLEETRDVLSEGRNCGIGFALLKKTAEGFFEGAQPISPCKDYLNDVVYTEHTGKPIGVWGLKTKVMKIFDGNAHMAISVCPYQGEDATKHDTFEVEREAMINNLSACQKLMNTIEDRLKIDGHTEMLQVTDNLVYAQLPKEWYGSTWLISLWSFMFRNFIYAASEDPFEAMLKTKDSGDSMTAKTVIAKIKKFEKEGLPKQDLASLTGPHTIHNCGIISY